MNASFTIQDINDWEYEHGEDFFTDGPGGNLYDDFPEFRKVFFKTLNINIEENEIPEDSWNAADYFAEIEHPFWEPENPELFYEAFINAVHQENLEEHLKKIIEMY